MIACKYHLVRRRIICPRIVRFTALSFIVKLSKIGAKLINHYIYIHLIYR